MKDTAIYIHIPFCDHKCIYCDFYSIITSDNIPAFQKAIKKEIEYYSKKYSSERIIKSIYFGGGTPSLMDPQYLRDIISTIETNFNLADSAEITMETNPGTVDLDKLINFRESGINRLSIGVQSFDDNDLEFMTRIHNRDTALETVHNANKADFENISIDLIFNLPGQTKKKWLKNLNIAIEQSIKHISAYSLILERGTILNKLVLAGKVTMQDDDHDAGLYELTIDYLTSSGYYQYEVSNFTRPGFECSHNNSYWDYSDYLGFGTSAHSFVNGKRWWNYSSLKRYLSEIEINNHAIANSEIISPDEKHNEYVMLALRSSGIRVDKYEHLFGRNWLQKNFNNFRELKNRNLMLQNGNVIKLTPAGYALCDEILKNIL